MKRKRTLLLCFLWATVIGPAASLRAHGDSLSELRVQLESSALRVSLSLSFRDLVRWVPPGSADYPAAVVAAMRQAQNDLIDIAYDDEPSAEPTDIAVSLPTPGVVRINFTYPAPPADAETLGIRTLHVDRLPTGHHQILVVEDARRHEGGIVIAQETLGTDQETASVDIPKASANPGRLKVVKPPPQPSARAGVNVRGSSAPKPIGAISTGSTGLWVLVGVAGVLILVCLVLPMLRKAPTRPVDQGKLD